MVRVRVTRLTTGASDSDVRPRRMAPTRPEGELVTLVGLHAFGTGYRAIVLELNGRSALQQITDAIRVGRRLCLRYDDGSHWWTTPIVQVEHSTRGLPEEVVTRSRSLYRIEYLDRVTLPGVHRDLLPGVAL